MLRSESAKFGNLSGRWEALRREKNKCVCKVGSYHCMEKLQEVTSPVADVVQHWRGSL